MNKVADNPFKTDARTSDAQIASAQTLPGAEQAARSNQALLVVAALFVTLYLVSNIMAVKVIGLFGLFYFDAGTLSFPFAYMLGDVLTDIWGFKTAKRVIWITFFCNLLMVIFTQLGTLLPSPDYLQATEQAYNQVFSYVPRIVLASLTGFLLGELSNAWLMEKIKQKTRGKKLWIRTIGSSAVAYCFDTLPFVLIAFAGLLSARDLLLMMCFQYGAKLLIEAVFGTPMAYAAIKGIRKYIFLK